MTDLEHLQHILLCMAKDLDTLCQKHGISYYLNGGNAIGAIRHKGFIPWDDDFDIMLTAEHYERFMHVCRKELDPNRYYVQEGGVDWPMMYSKIRLKDTFVKDREEYQGTPEKCAGIWIDVFKLDYVSNCRTIQIWQYVCGKFYNAYTLRKRGYKSAPVIKKTIMALTFILDFPPLRKFVLHQTVRYNNKKTEYIGSFWESTRLKNFILPASVYGTPLYVPYDDTRLPVPEQYNTYLTHLFGNYMILPPENKRKRHISEIDFGNY